MIPELALAALNNYLNRAPAVAERADTSGFKQELQRASGSRAGDPAPRSEALTDEADAAARRTRAGQLAESAATRQAAAPATAAAGNNADSSTATRPAARPANPANPTNAAEPTRRGAKADASSKDKDTEGTAAAAAVSQAIAGSESASDGAVVVLDAADSAAADPKESSSLTPDAGIAQAAQAAQAARATAAVAGAPLEASALAAAIAGRAAAGEQLSATADGAEPTDRKTSGVAGEHDAAGARRGALSATTLEKAGLAPDADGKGKAAPLPDPSAGPASREALASRGELLDTLARAERPGREHAGAHPTGTVALASDFAGMLSRVESAAAPAAPAGATAVQAQVGSSAFGPELTERISTLVSGGIERAEITVSPKELGPVRIELTMTGDDARLVFTAAHPDTRQAIEQSSALLRSMLADQGLNLARMDVGQGGQPPPDQSQRSFQDNRSADGAGGSAISAGSNAGSPTRVAARGLLDLFA